MNNTVIVLIALVILVITNLVSFFLMMHDKNCAKKGSWRVPEATLFIATACFGGLGGVLGMQLLRHKTKHWYFAVFFPLMLVVQVILLAVGAYFLFMKEFGGNAGLCVRSFRVTNPASGMKPEAGFDCYGVEKMA